MDNNNDLMNFLAVISPIAMTILGFLLSRMIKKIDDRLEVLTVSVAQLVTDVEVMKNKHDNHNGDIKWLLNKVEEQFAINNKHELEIRNNRHDVKSAIRNNNTLLEFYKDLNVRVDKLEK